MLYYLAIPLVGVAYLLSQWSATAPAGYLATCQAIQAVISSESAVYYPGSHQHESDIKHWLPNTSQNSTCSVQPGNTPDVAAIIKVLGKTTTPFAIKGGGRTFNNFSSTPGVLIAMTRFDEVTYDKKSNSVTLGMGGIWTNVFKKLEKQGLTVSGGRIAGVGVGGYLLGGGYSYLSDESGLSMDNVISYEVVLPNGTITTASDTNNPDLFWGLKGGFNNFGIVTRAITKAFPLGKVWGGEIVYTGDSLNLLPDALEKYASMQNSTDWVSGGGIVCVYRWAPDSAPAAVLQVFYDGTNPPERYLAMFDHIPSVSSNLQTWQYTDLIGVFSKNLQNENNLRAALTTVSISTITATVVTQFMEIMNDLESHFPSVAQGILMFEPFVPGQILKPDYDGVFPHNVFASPLNAALWWTDASQDANGLKALDVAANKMQDALRTDLQPVDAMMLYPNYADANHPIEHLYGPNVPKAKALRKKYDPEGVMLRAPGWKFI